MHQFLTFHPMTWPQRSRLRFIVLNLSRCAVYIIVSRVSPSVYASLLPLPSGFCYSMFRRPFSPLALIPFAVFSQFPSYTTYICTGALPAAGRFVVMDVALQYSAPLIGYHRSLTHVCLACQRRPE